MYKISATIDHASIDKKLKAWERSPDGIKTMGDKVADYIIDGKEKTEAGSRVTTLRRVEELAEVLKSLIVSASGEAPKSVVSNVSSLSSGEAYHLGDGRIELAMSFSDNLSRPSLDAETYPEGAENIIVLFDQGYSAKGSVKGMWHGEMTVSLRKREGLGFLERAVDNFNSIYGPEWDIKATLQDPYA